MSLLSTCAKLAALQALLACRVMSLIAACNDLCVCVHACGKAAQEDVTKAPTLLYFNAQVIQGVQQQACVLLPTGESDSLLSKYIREINLDGGGGRKSWDPGAADMVEAPGCQTEGRCIRSQPSTTS